MNNKKRKTQGNRKAILSKITSKVVQILEDQYYIVRGDGNRMKHYHETYKIIEKCAFNLSEGDFISLSRNEFDLFVMATANQLAQMTCWFLIEERPDN
jgi:hypothetical protein